MNAHIPVRDRGGQNDYGTERLFQERFGRVPTIPVDTFETYLLASSVWEVTESGLTGGQDPGETMVDVENLFLRGKEAADRGNYAYAIALFGDALRAAPDHHNARIALRGCEMEVFRSRGSGVKAKLVAFFKGIGPLILMHLQKKRPDRVMAHCEQYLVNDPTNLYVLKRLATACVQRGYLEAAADTLEFARQRNPRNIGVLRSLGEVHYAQGTYDKAIRSFQEIVSIKPEDREAVQRAKQISAEAHLKRSHMEGAASFRESLRDADKARDLARKEQLVHSATEQDAEIIHLIQAVEASPEDAEAHLRLGDAYYTSERYAEAEKAYRKAFEIGKRYGMREKMGNARIRQLEQLERKARQEIDDSGRSPAALAKARDATKKRLEFCVKEYSFRRQHHPTDMNLARQLGQYYFDLGGDENIQKAIQQFQQAMSSSSLKLRARYMLGRCFALNPKTVDMAKEQFETALAELENPVGEMGKTLTYEIGQIEETLGNEAEALTHYKKIFAVDAGYRDVAKKIQTLG